jgi:hypothetical protein
MYKSMWELISGHEFDDIQNKTLEDVAEPWFEHVVKPGPRIACFQHMLHVSISIPKNTSGQSTINYDAL